VPILVANLNPSLIWLVFFASAFHNPLKEKRKAFASGGKGGLKETKRVSTVETDSMSSA
jgi:hypothetical protein